MYTTLVPKSPDPSQLDLPSAMEQGVLLRKERYNTLQKHIALWQSRERKNGGKKGNDGRLPTVLQYKGISCSF